MTFNLKEAQENIDRICDWIERVNAPNPLNPVGMSDLSYYRAMDGLHDETWITEFFV